jgi:hypothetical protein
VKVAIVTDPDDRGHIDLVLGDDGAIEDVLVEVITQPGLVPLTARMSQTVPSPGGGVWELPYVGAECVVAIPDGSYRFMPTIVGWLSAGSVPDDVGEGRLVVESGELRLRATTGSAYMKATGGGDAILDGATVKLGSSASEAVIKGDAYIGAEGTFYTQFNLWLEALNAALVAAGLVTPALETYETVETVLKTAITTFTSGDYLSSKAKTE